MQDPRDGREPPRVRIERERLRRGAAAFAAGCADLIEGRQVDPELVRVLGGRSVEAATGPPEDYWLRVWATRGLLWGWDGSAFAALVTALGDEAWRVREMALKVVARHRLEDALELVVALQDDPVPRVRAAASRALVRVVSDG